MEPTGPQSPSAPRGPASTSGSTGSSVPSPRPASPAPCGPAAPGAPPDAAAHTAPPDPADTRARLSIGDLAEATGVPVETIRMWERRYGRPASHRLPSGHRRYTEEQARWLRDVAEAVARGLRASAAVTASPERLRAFLAPTTPTVAEDIEQLLLDVSGMRSTALRRRLRADAATRPVTEHLEGLVGPLLREIGRAWSEGRIDVRHEHHASGIVSAHLARLRSRRKPRPRAPRVVLATLPGERHGLGAAMAALVAADAGLRLVDLGVDLPVQDIATTARESGARAVLLSISVARGGVAADRLVAELRGALPDTCRLLVGGAGATGPRRPPAGAEIVDDLRSLRALLAEFVPPGGAALRRKRKSVPVDAPPSAGTAGRAGRSGEGAPRSAAPSPAASGTTSQRNAGSFPVGDDRAGPRTPGGAGPAPFPPAGPGSTSRRAGR